jgi:membrane protein required for colicin V production
LVFIFYNDKIPHYFCHRMNYLDILLLIPILFGAWRGFKKGIIIELFTLLALLVGIYAAIHFSDYMVNILKDNFDFDGEYTPVFAFILTFLIVGAMVFFLGKALEKVIKIVQLSALNKFAGVVFGVTKMLFVSSIIVVVLESIDQKNDFISKELKDTSVLYEPFKKVSFTAMPAIQESTLFKKNNLFDRIIEGVEDKLEN